MRRMRVHFVRLCVVISPFRWNEQRKLRLFGRDVVSEYAKFQRIRFHGEGDFATGWDATRSCCPVWAEPVKVDNILGYPDGRADRPRHRRSG